LSKSQRSRQVSITAFREEYERNIERLKSDKRHKSKRMSTVEPVFGTLINFLGMRKVNTLGKAGAHECILQAVCAFNPKKLLKYDKKPIKTMTRHLEIQTQTRKTKPNVLFALIDFLTSQIRPSNHIFQNDLS
jgi:hypothetical protein